MFAVRLWADARQTFVFAVCPETDARQSLFTNGYSSNLERTLTFTVHQKKTHGKVAKFAVRMFEVHGKDVPLPCVICWRTAKVF
jgi:hypothetical protein